jgi:TPR repeat protein
MVLSILLLGSLSFLTLAQTTQATPSVAAIEKQAEALLRANKRPQALAEYLRAAKLGSAKSQNMVAWMYRFGLGTTIDYGQAMSWYQKAAAQGNAQAEEGIGRLYQTSGGVARDYAQALKWYEKAAAQGDASAQYSIGSLYLNGWGVTQNQAQARVWFQMSADQGDYQAKEMLAKMNAQGPQPRTSAAATTQPTQAVAGQGTCTAIHSALHSDDFGHWYSFGAAWGRSSLAEAESAARSELIKASNGMSINFNSDEVLTPFSGCTYGHGAVVAKLKGINGSLLGNGIYDLVSGVVDATTQGAIASAMEDCNRVAGTGDSDGPCTVMLQW